MSAKGKRYEAKLKGCSRYYTGLPCKHGHTCERSTLTGECIVCRRIKKRRHEKAYPDKTRLMLLNWKLRNIDRVKTHKQTDYRRHYARVVKSCRKWRKNNPGKVNAQTARRRAQQFLATPKWANAKKIREIYITARCLKKHHVDHIVPLNSSLVCGLHCEDNLQILTGAKNRAKGNRVWPDMPC